MTSTAIAVNPFVKFPVTGYAAVTVRSPRWDGDQVIGYDDEESYVRVPAGRSPESMIGWSKICGDEPIAARLITRREFRRATRPAALATDGGEF
jgi:hypothetical protein